MIATGATPGGTKIWDSGFPISSYPLSRTRTQKNISHKKLDTQMPKPSDAGQVLCLWRDGRLITGRWVIDESGTVIVTSGRRQLATQRGNSDPDQVAKWLLRDLDKDRGAA